MGRRRSRRRYERRRAKERQPARRLTVTTRIGLVAGGALAVIAGVALLTHGSSSNTARLGRVSGILMLVGLVAIGVGLLGRI